MSAGPAIGAGLAQWVGYRPAFLILGGFALAALVLWLAFRATTRAACETAPKAEPANA